MQILQDKVVAGQAHALLQMVRDSADHGGEHNGFLCRGVDQD